MFFRVYNTKRSGQVWSGHLRIKRYQKKKQKRHEGEKNEDKQEESDEQEDSSNTKEEEGNTDVGVGGYSAKDFTATKSKFLQEHV